MKINIEDIKKEMKVELISEIRDRIPGLSGVIEDIEYIDYEPSAIWIRWHDLDKSDRFDLSYSPNILDKLKSLE